MIKQVGPLGTLFIQPADVDVLTDLLMFRCILLITEASEALGS